MGLADLLRRHVAALTSGGHDSLVFAIKPSGPTFRRDRDQAGIAHMDFRRRRFSPHSARKFFSTCLTTQGIPEKMVDFLMRHAGRVEHRYYDPGLEEQAEAVGKLPELWPECGHSVDNSDSSSRDLTKRRRLVEDGTGTSELHSIPLPALTSHARSANDGLSSRARGEVEATGAAGHGRGQVESPGFSDPEIGISGLNLGVVTRADPNALADLFATVARLLRPGAGHDGLTRKQHPNKRKSKG